MFLQRILYIASEISPFLKNSLVAECARKLPEAMQNKQLDVRLMVPKFGTINDRMNRLHEVLRLSGGVIQIHNVGHVVSVKVSTIPNTRLQVYFIDNLDLFANRRGVFEDAAGKFFIDNDLRMAFFCAGVIQTLKKLEWEPDIVHCHDWITSFVPILWKKLRETHTLFGKAKLISTIYNNTFSCNFPLLSKIAIELGIAPEDAALLIPGSFRSIIQLIISHSDLVVSGEKLVAVEFEDLFHTKELYLVQDDDQYSEAYLALYRSLISG